MLNSQHRRDAEVEQPATPTCFQLDASWDDDGDASGKCKEEEEDDDAEDD